MKIIGTVGDSSYLVPMRPEELDNLQDCFGGSGIPNPVLIGREFQVNQARTTLRNLRNEVKELTKTARRCGRVRCVQRL